MASEAQRAACKRYYERTKGQYKVIVLRLNRNSCGDVIDRLEGEPNKTKYITGLIRDDIRGN